MTGDGVSSYSSALEASINWPKLRSESEALAILSYSIFNLLGFYFYAGIIVIKGFSAAIY